MTKEMMIPARQVLTTAEATNRRLGHENLGFLSEAHGFMPITPPLRRLPPAYQAWDQVAAELPHLHRNLAVRRVLDAMPTLDASAEALPDKYLLRASVILSAFAQAYHHCEPNPPDELPVCIQRPWAQVSQRLDRPAPHLSLIDRVVYNWQSSEPDGGFPTCSAKLRLLVTLWANEADHNFSFSNLDMMHRSTPLVGAVVRAQEAVQRDDADGLASELIRISDCIHQLTHSSLMKANPNPYSDSFVEPVVWAKTVALSDVPIRAGRISTGGAALPTLHLLDMFFARATYNSSVGHESKLQHAWAPKHWRELLAAVAQLSVTAYVQRKGNNTLTAIFQDALQAYAGPTGCLARHGLKAYGYLDTAFKIGRTVTNSGISGPYKDRPWDDTANRLDEARLERYGRFQSEFYHHVPLRQRAPMSANGARQAHQIVFDLAGTGLRYQPGDRVAILPENSAELVARTLQALRARGDEPIQLNAAWREAIAARPGYQGVQTVALRTLLRLGRIRPVARTVAKALYAITYNETLKRILAARAEDQWELWDLLNLLAGAGFNPRSLWKAQPGDRQHICAIVPPERFRLYSISSALDEEQSENGAELHLTVGQLHYQTQATDLSAPGLRQGTSSTFLHQAPPESTTQCGVALRIVHPPRFSLPQDATRPIVMFAGGTGIAPFRGFLQARARQAGAGEKWLFFGARTRADFYYQQELEQWAAHGQVQVRVAFSREDVALRFVGGEDGRFVFEPGNRQRIDEEMLRPQNARLLWELLCSRAEGGREGYFYVCGQTGFANSVLVAIKTILERFAAGPEETRAQTARQQLYRLVGQDRLMQDIFTTYSGPQIEQRQRYDASEVILHTNDEAGYWLIIDGRVYDMSEFGHLHPGGFKIIRAYAGMDATHAYQQVRHHSSPEIDALLGMYEIGVVRRLDFGAAWGVAIGPKGLTVVTLAEAYRTWVRYLYTLIELENALHNDFSVRTEAVTYDETRAAPAYSPYKLQLLLQIQARFLSDYLPEILGEKLADLWAVVSGLCGERTQANWMNTAIAAIQQSETAQRVGGLGETLMARLKATLQEHPTPDAAVLQPLIDGCERCEDEAKRLLRELRLALRVGLQVFETYEQRTIPLGGGQLLAALRAIPEVLAGYYARLAAGLPAGTQDELTNIAQSVTEPGLV